MPENHDYAKYASAYATLGLDGGYFLAFRDLPPLLEKYVHGNKALDYGCGAGRSTRFLKNLGYDVIGADISSDMLRQAIEQDDAGDYRRIASAQLLFEDETFDLVFSSFVFLEVPTFEEITAIFGEMKRVTKRGGTVLAIANPAEAFNAAGRYMSFSFDFPENHQPKKSGDTVSVRILGTDVVLHDFYWTRNDFERATESVGLVEKEVHTPLGKDDDGVEWLDEKTCPIISLYVYQRPS